MSFLTPHAIGERAVLMTFLLHQLTQLRASAYGLTDEQIHQRSSASELSLAMVLRHCAQVAAEWADACAVAPQCPSPDREITDDHFQSSEQHRTDTVEEVLADFDRCTAYTSERLASIDDLTAQVPIPEAHWFPADLGSWEVRRVLVHVIAELARHAGHADIIRESIDGKISYELNARADGMLADDQAWEAPRFE